MESSEIIGKEVRNNVEAYSKVRELAKNGKYTEASRALNASGLAQSTKNYLGVALASEEATVVEKAFREIDLRIGNALCSGCWDA